MDWTLYRIASLIATVSIVLCLAWPNAVSTTLPESYELLDADKGPVKIDPALERWFSEHTGTMPPTELTPEQYSKFIGYQDSVSRAWLDLVRANAGLGKKPDALKAAIQTANENQSPEASRHPILPYLLGEILSSSDLDETPVGAISDRLNAIGDVSCPRRDLVINRLNAGFPEGVSTSAVRSRLQELDRFRSKIFLGEAYEAFLAALPSEQREPLRDELYQRVSGYDDVVEDNKWLLVDVGEKKERLLEKVRRNAKRRRCSTAKGHLIDLYKDSSYKKADILSATDVTGRCFRRRGQFARRKFWQDIEKPLAGALGFEGAAHAQTKLGLLAWSNDSFDKARKIFLQLAQDAAAKGVGEVEANSLFTLARIEENDSKFERSLLYYRQFADHFPEHKEYLKVETAMVLLNFMLGNEDAALANIEEILASQSKLKIDERSTSSLSFALFWAGRLHLAKNRRALAHEMWRRVAAEFYSTFYGALGHYMLERLDGSAKVLAPARSSRFSSSELFSKFDEKDRVVINRITALLRLGMQEEASCELVELRIPDLEKEKVLAKSLLQNAAGEWLSSIKNFDSLPRSYRHGLPSGFERLLFPRAYEGEVSSYSDKVGVDADLVLAIIRQESVFNPKARSSAGARGLMQLMPATARLEAKRLSRSYLPWSKRKALRTRTRKRSNLFKADTNLALGVHHVYYLFKKYGNPIFVLTSYNANPRATERWKANLATEDPLTFIERIPYRETKMYVKLVMRNYFYYKRWYRGPEQKLDHLDDLTKGMSFKVAKSGG